MFFFAAFGIDNKQKHIGTYNNTVCPSCGALTRFEIYKAYTYFHVFFIPTFRWNVKYIVKTACCSRLYELDPAAGKEFEKNPNTVIRKENLRQMDDFSPLRYCSNCRTEVPSEFSFCPYCGKKL